MTSQDNELKKQYSWKLDPMLDLLYNIIVRTLHTKQMTPLLSILAPIHS